jgi:hypothetical protein
LYAFLVAKTYWPAGQAANYTTATANAVAWLLANASVMNVSTRDDGVNICPSGSGSCKAVYWYGEGEQTYSTGIVAGAVDLYGIAAGPNTVATTTGPLAGMTWLQIAQGITNAFAASQSTTADNPSYGYYGGWRYSIPGNGDSDTSTTQWGVFSFIYDAAVGATTPASAKPLLAHYLTSVQQASGGVCYDTTCGIGPDHSDAGGWLLSESYIGTPSSSAQVQKAITWLNTNWQSSPSNTWYGFFGHPYASLAVYKGLEANIGTGGTGGINNLLYSTCGGNLPSGTSCNWYQDMVQWLVANQNLDGSWSGYQYWVDPISTGFDVSILSATVVPVAPPPLTGTPAPGTLLLAGLGIVALATFYFVARRRSSSMIKA